MYASTHEMPPFPGTGELGERGEHDRIVNAPLRAGDTGQVFREAMREAILLRLADFAPDLLVVSAGFDAHRRDPLANLSLVEDDFVWIARKLIESAQKGWNGRNVSSAGRRLRSAKPCLLRQRACRNADGGLRTQSARFLCRRHSGVSRLEKSSWHHDEFRGRNRTLLTTQRTSRYWRRGVVAVVHHPCASPCARHEDRVQDDAYGG